MSWVSPVKDDKALHEFEDGLKKPVKNTMFCLRSVWERV